MTTNSSTAKEISESIGCSTATVMLRAKALGFKFKGRTPSEHNTLLGSLTTVSPRKRKTKKNGESKQLPDLIKDHLECGKKLIVAAETLLGSITEEQRSLEIKKSNLLAQIDCLSREQQDLTI